MGRVMVVPPRTRRAARRDEDQQPVLKALTKARKSKRSRTPLWSKSAVGSSALKALTKARKSNRSSVPLASKSGAQAAESRSVRVELVIPSSRVQKPADQMSQSPRTSNPPLRITNAAPGTEAGTSIHALPSQCQNPFQPEAQRSLGPMAASEPPELGGG